MAGLIFLLDEGNNLVYFVRNDVPVLIFLINVGTDFLLLVQRKIFLKVLQYGLLFFNEIYFASLTTTALVRKTAQRGLLS